MTNEQVNQTSDDDFNVSLLDPASWEEPKDRIPVEVIRSRLRWSGPEYNKATEFRAEFPNRGKGPEGNSIQQWDFVLKRLDAVYRNEDGSNFIDRDGNDLGPEAPVFVYAGCDLEKMDKQGNIRGIMKTRGKEQRIITAWTKMVGALVPDPSRLEGKKFLVDHYREMEVAPGFFAKRVTLPVEVLPVDYEYTGQVQVFKANKDKQAGATASDVTGSSGASDSGVDKAEAAQQIAAFLKSEGLSVEDVDAATLGHPNFPAAARVEPFTSAFAAGTLREVLTANGIEL